MSDSPNIQVNASEKIEMAKKNRTYLYPNLVGMSIDNGRLEFVGLLGSGGCADVLLARNVGFRCVDKAGVDYTDDLYAVKVWSKFEKSERQVGLFRQEIEMHRLASFPYHRTSGLYPNSSQHIVKLVNVVETRFTLFLVMTYHRGWDLYTQIWQGQHCLSTKAMESTGDVSGPFHAMDVSPGMVDRDQGIHSRERQEHVRDLLLQLVDGLAYLHSLNIAHRDIKPDNLLYVKPTQDKPFILPALSHLLKLPFSGKKQVKKTGTLLICDFGLATTESICQIDGHGTTQYLAPEALGFQNIVHIPQPALKDWHCSKVSVKLAEVLEECKAEEEESGEEADVDTDYDSSGGSNTVGSGAHFNLTGGLEWDDLRSSATSQDEVAISKSVMPASKFSDTTTAESSAVVSAANSKASSPRTSKVTLNLTPPTPQSQHEEDVSPCTTYGPKLADIWSLGVTFIYVTHHVNLWQVALPLAQEPGDWRGDEDFREFIDDPHGFLRRRLPDISEDYHRLLIDILSIEPRERPSLAAIRLRLLKLDRFLEIDDL